ncbi:MAG: S9 family peptidase [Bacteroidales bacterium]|nr:S9 family peptidase [Bacteroidales bacterium]
MKIFRIVLLACAVIGLYSCDTEKSAPMIPMKDFFKNPEKTKYQISPDGNHVSYMAPWETRLNIFVKKTGKEEVNQITFEKDRSIHGYMWANENRILYIRDEGGNEDFKLYGVDLDGANSKCLTCFEGVRTQLLDDLKDIKDEIIIGLNKRDARVYDPYRLNIVTGELTMLAENPGNITGWKTDHEGKLRLAIAMVGGVNVEILYRDNEEDEFETIISTTWKDEFTPKLFTFDNKKLYAMSNIGRDKAALVIFDPKTKTEEEVLYQNDNVDVTYLGYSRKRKIITTAYYTTDKQQAHYFDSESENLMKNLEAKLPGYEIAISSENDDENIFLIRTYSDRSRGSYYLYEKETGKLEKLADVSPWINEDNMAEMKPITYQSRDGLTIHGYLTLPKGKAENLPVVIHPHGGPWHRDKWAFNPEVQFLANRGYAVLQMNFRGSTGYGKEFWLKSVKQWGRTMQDDITDGVNWLIDQGIADPKRVGIYGASYGGYAVLAGLTITPDLYACGVDYVGVSNMFTFLNTIPPYWEPMREMLYEMVGHPQEDSVMLREVSPVYLVDNIKAPLFVAQGANDPRVKINESDQIVEALKAKGVDVEYMVKEDEGHGFYNEENRFDFYTAMEKFLATHLGGKMEE